MLPGTPAGMTQGRKSVEGTVKRRLGRARARARGVFEGQGKEKSSQRMPTSPQAACGESKSHAGEINKARMQCVKKCRGGKEMKNEYTSSCRKPRWGLSPFADDRPSTFLKACGRMWME